MSRKIRRAALADTSNGQPVCRIIGAYSGTINWSGEMNGW